MSGLYRDRRFYFLLIANVLSSIGSGITMIAIPWLLVSKVDGGTIFGYTTIAMTAVNFIVTPSIGHLIDQTSRKKILLFGEAIGFWILVAFSMVGFFGFDYEIWHYLVLYGTGSFYYTLFYPTMFAFTQEIFDKSVYKSLNGAMEIQGQAASVIAGALGAVIVSKIELEWLLMFDAFTYIGAYFLFKQIPYTRVSYPSKNVSFWLKTTEGYRYMKEKPILFLFLAASVMPFIGVMVTNYLFPVYLSDVLNVDASVYGMQSMVYGIGAVIAGIIIPVIANKMGNEKSIVVTVLIYTIGISFIGFITEIPLYFMFTIFLAFGNAGSRVARNSFIMENVPNEIVGRVDSLFRVIGLIIRVALLLIFTQFTANNHVLLSFYLLAGLLLLAFLIVLFTAKMLNKEEAALKINMQSKNTAL